MIFLEPFWWRLSQVSLFLRPLIFKNKPDVQDTKATGWKDWEGGEQNGVLSTIGFVHTPGKAQRRRGESKQEIDTIGFLIWSS